MKIVSFLYYLVEVGSKLILLLFRVAAIVLWATLTLLGLYNIVHQIGKDFDSTAISEKLPGDILPALEILFISPIPIMIIESYKKYILSIFPLGDDNKDKKEKEVSAKNEFSVRMTTINEGIKSEDAEKSFIACLIGVTSTYIIGKIFDAFGNSAIDTHLILTVSAAFIFLLIQIFYFHIINADIKSRK